MQLPVKGGRTGGRPRRLTQEQYEQVGRLLAGGCQSKTGGTYFLISAFQPFIVIILRAFSEKIRRSLCWAFTELTQNGVYRSVDMIIQFIQEQADYYDVQMGSTIINARKLYC
ncbi:hypothetical protein OHD50_06880 [Escherichia coli]|nr:hypothetical protein [Escherichia coli]